MPTTYHLALTEEWLASVGDEDYAPGAYEREGFIHCTDGDAEMVATANRHYLGHPGPFVVLEVDLSLVDAPVRYEDERGVYPHIYGRLPRSSVIGERAILRSADGTFVGLGDASRP